MGLCSNGLSRLQKGGGSDLRGRETAPTVGGALSGGKHRPAKASTSWSPLMMRGLRGIPAAPMGAYWPAVAAAGSGWAFWISLWIWAARAAWSLAEFLPRTLEIRVAVYIRRLTPAGSSMMATEFM